MQNELVEKRRSFAARAAFPAYMLVAIPYLVWRIETVATWGEWYFWLLVAGEALSVSVTLLYLGTARRISVPVFRPAPTRTVDIFIPTYNEPVEVVELTVIGALAVRGTRTVFVLDDGRRPTMRAMAESLGARYLTRSDNAHAKAGNMNAGIRHSDAEFMLFLDCDHVPQPQIIERTLGYFGDPGLAFVQTPQLFYNTDSIQFRPTARRPLWNEQSMFYEAIQPSKNCFNAAFFCGSGALVRRAAIDAIGGFATGTATEDIHTSLRLHAGGWRSLYVNEQLAHGIAPINLAEYHKQRSRWGAGSLGLLFCSPDSPLRAAGLSLAQRVCYFNSTFSFTFGLQRLFFFLFPATLLMFLPLTLNDKNVDVLFYLGIMIAFVGFSYACAWVISDGTYHPVFTEQYNLANMCSHVMALRGILNVQKKFEVSVKTGGRHARAGADVALPLLCAILMGAAAIGLATWALAGRPWAGLLHNMAGLALFWDAYNIGLIVPFLLFLRRHRAKGDRACAIALPEVRATLAGPRTSMAVALNGLDLAGASLLVPEGWSGCSEQVLVAELGGRTLRIPAWVAGQRDRADGRQEVRLAFTDLPPEIAVPLATYLFQEVVPQTLRYGPVPSRQEPILAPLTRPRAAGELLQPLQA